MAGGTVVKVYNLFRLLLKTIRHKLVTRLTSKFGKPFQKRKISVSNRSEIMSDGESVGIESLGEPSWFLSGDGDDSSHIE